MQLILEDSGQALTMQELDEFQQQFDAQLPAGFRQFYLQHNGGDLSDDHGDNDLLLGGFTPIKYGMAPIETVYRDLTDSVPFLQGMIPFAYDRFGHSFLLSLNKDDYGTIYLYLMDEEELALVSDCFDDFMAELTG
ncbi:SMI1/KNR4 family protein [Xanthomonas sp. NCPPB 2654]|uniref:SMI1/KNR4 family protein n=1 Tax=unclassified Xanthomonas TaxID=2643310 RepID=UPI0021DFA0E4|nr:MULTISPECIES: SMI1/KNR4 family protein [unclassified Xanthomonas]MDL5368108.1 SMI1/KNR4 family protein [Xanthomonas sp. NCPPB 2654]UYC19345.1 SMI1/KNR4 family protein [Xanthomonas sp. CFBP 8443]